MKDRVQAADHKRAITFCYRGFAANFGTRHMVASILEQAGHDVEQIKDGPADFSADSVVWIWGNTNWYPGLYEQLTACLARNGLWSCCGIRSLCRLPGPPDCPGRD